MARLLGRVGVDLGCVATTSAYSQMDGRGLPQQNCPSLLKRVALAQLFGLASLILDRFHFNLFISHMSKIKIDLVNVSW